MNSRILVGILMVAGVGSASAANLLVNPSFEDPITSDGPPFVGFWEGFSGGATATAANSMAQARTGAQSLELSILTTPNSFAGAFQDVTGLTPGTEYMLSGWHLAPAAFAAGTELRVEWRNAGSDMEITRTPNLTPVPTDAWSLFSLTATVPDGADTARVVYAIQTFSGGGADENVVYVDDVSFDIVPEPSSAVLLAAAGGLALLARRRRG